MRREPSLRLESCPITGYLCFYRLPCLFIHARVDGHIPWPFPQFWQSGHPVLWEMAGGTLHMIDTPAQSAQIKHTSNRQIIIPLCVHYVYNPKVHISTHCWSYMGDVISEEPCTRSISVCTQTVIRTPNVCVCVCPTSIGFWLRERTRKFFSSFKWSNSSRSTTCTVWCEFIMFV